MKLTRRNFLAWAGIAATGAIACDVFDDELKVQSPALIPEDLVSGRDTWYATYDASVPGGQGILVRVMEGRAKKVRGNPRFPTNQGKQSAAADAILQSLYHPDRIAGPMLRTGPRGSGQFRPITWEEALNRFNAAVDERGSEMLLITESRGGSFARICIDFANAFGGRHLAYDGLDDAAYRSAVKDVLGSDALPYHDIENASTLVSFGSDFLSTWGSPTAYGVAYGKFRSGEHTHHRGTHIHFGARYSLTAANADKWVPIAPGAEGYAAMALAWGIAEAHPESEWVQAITGEAGPGALRDFAPDAMAGTLQMPDAVLDGQSPNDFFKNLAHDYAAHGGLAIGGGGEAGAYSNGKFNASATLMLNFIMGNVGHKGGLMVNPAVENWGLQPNVAPATLGDWQRAAGDISNGVTRLVIVHNADPVYGLPPGVGLGAALSNENVAVISSSSFIDETSVMADLIIPDRAALEEWGDHLPEPMPGYGVYGVQQPVVNPLPDLDPRSFADVMLASAADLGRGDMMAAGSYEELIRATVAEIAADFDEALRYGGEWDINAKGETPSPSGNLLDAVAGMAGPAATEGSGDFQLTPFAHHTVLDGRNAHLPWAQNAPDPVTTVAWQTWVEINEKQGRETMGLREGDVVNVSTSAGSIQALVYLNPGMPPGIAAVPMGGGRRSGSEYATGRDSRESGNVMSIVAVSANDAGGLTWSGNRCTITPTGDSMAVSKMEGGYTSREIGEHPAEQVFKTVTGEGGH